MQIVNLTGAASQVAGGDALFGNVPQELKELRQWVVWRATPRPNASGDNRIAKPPMRLDNPAIGAVHTDPSGWGTFDEAVSVARRYASTVSGIGLFLTRNDPYVCVDVDDEGKVEPQYLDMRRQFVQELLGLGTYAELSPSKNGLHVWMRGQTEAGGKHNKRMGSEVYAFETFVTVTGDRFGQAQGVADCQQYIDRLGFGVTGRSSQPAAPLVDDPDLPLGLTDEEVVQRGRGYVSWFSNQFDGHAECDPGEWSHTFRRVLGVLAKVSGSVEQLWRITYGSGMVQAAPAAAGGETRPHKARRTFQGELLHVRAGNRGAGEYFREHGKAVWSAIEQYKQEQARITAEKVRAAQEELGQLSAKASSLLDYFPMLDGGEHRLLSHPPGVTGEFVRATEAASHAPYLKFAVPATLAALAGIMGRAYKTQSGGGINVNFILAAPSSTGKTQTMHAWQWFMNDALAAMPMGPQGPPRSRILNNGTSSIQGIMADFEDVPSCAWFIEECQSQLTSMSSAKSPVEAALRDSYNQLYDCAKHGHQFSPPRSVASRNANVQPINNLSVSTYWTTTTSKFDVFSDDALDGFLSRVVIIRHQGPAGALQREVRGLDERLVAVLVERLSLAAAVDAEYRMAGAGPGATAAARIVRVDQSLVQDLDWELVLRCENIKNASLRGELPPTYTSASRLPQTAMRVAVVLAAMENPYAPQVTPAQLKWAFGYLLQNTVALLSDMDRGEVGAQQGDDFAAVARGYAALAKGGKYASMPGIPRGELTALLKTYKPFTSNVTLGRSKAVTNTLDHMLKEGLVEEVCPPAVGRGRPTKYIVPVLGNELWGSIRAA